MRERDWYHPHADRNRDIHMHTLECIIAIKCIIANAYTTGMAVLTYCYAYSARVLRKDVCAHRIRSNPFDHLIFEFWTNDSFDHGIKLGVRSYHTNLRIRQT